MKYYHIFRTNDTNEKVECTTPLEFIEDVEFKGDVTFKDGNLLKEVRDIPVSFETDEVLKIELYFPYKVTINKIRAIATKAIADTDTATITCGNETGASTGGVVTFSAGDAIATKKTATPTTNNVVLADEHYYLTTAKTTPGGKAIVSIEYTRTA